MRTEQELQVVVDNGSKWLDEKEPEWHRFINLKELRMAASCDCVLGQIQTVLKRQSSSPFGAYVTSNNLSADFIIDNGFFGQSEEYTFLDQMWITAIEKRIANDNL